MSHPALSLNVRRLSKPRSVRAAVTAVSSPAQTLGFSAPFCYSAYRTAIAHSVSRRGSNSRPNTSSIASPSCFKFVQPRSAFSSSAVRAAAQVTQNPRTDDDGNTLMIGISERAANRLRQITDPSTSPSATQAENPYHHLRITVTSGGCHGFQYLMSLEAASKINAEEDTIFEAEDPSLEGSSGGDAKVVMDEPSLELLSGSTVDYTTELIGSQFKIVDNPRATSSCGCGTSFDVVD